MRGFKGSAQVRTNWERIFASIPNLTAEVLRSVVDGEQIWSEWELRDVRPDGQLPVLRGVIIFGLSGGHAAWCRFYLEPVDAGEGGVNAAVGRIIGTGSTE